MRRYHIEVRWEGASLVIATGDYTGEQRETGIWHEQEERWTLLATDQLQIVVRARSSDAPATDDAAIYTHR
jgi:hypothetical protein